jgi:hypothetical protein
MPMNTPVFDKEGHFLGDLILYQYESVSLGPFRRPLNIETPVLRLKEMESEEIATIEYVAFDHCTLTTHREDGRMFALKVIVADRPDLLHRLSGYRSFMEIFGREVESIPERAMFRTFGQ